MKVKWNMMESLSSNMSSGIEVMAIWEGRRNHSGLSAALAICSHHWQSSPHFAYTSDQQVGCGFFIGGTLPYES